jgi:hypothetical protein
MGQLSLNTSNGVTDMEFTFLFRVTNQKSSKVYFKSEEHAYQYLKTLVALGLKYGRPVIQYVGDNAWIIKDINDYSPEGYYTIHWKGDRNPTEHAVEKHVLWDCYDELNQGDQNGV